LPITPFADSNALQRKQADLDISAGSASSVQPWAEPSGSRRRRPAFRLPDRRIWSRRFTPMQLTGKVLVLAGIRV